MMIQAVLGNPHHPEYGVATIPFPIPRDQYAHCMELLEALEIGDAVKADCKVEKIDSFYTVLKRTEMLTVNVEELNYLAKRLDSFDTGEAAQFQAMAHKLELFELKDLINLTFCCQQATVITDFSDLAAIGRDHYMNLHGGSASVDELNTLDGKETARQLIESGSGTITPYGVVYDNGMKLEQVYDGRFFPCYYYEPNAITVAVTSKAEPEDTEHITWLLLPMVQEEIDRALLRGGITDPADVRLRLEDSQLPNEVDVLLDMEYETLSDLNELAEATDGLSKADMEKLGLFGPEHCVGDRAEQDYIGKVLVLSPDTLKESCWSQENQLWYAHDGFGCSPHAIGRSVRCTCLSDGEMTRWNRDEFVGVLDEKFLPDWAKESLSQFQQEEAAESPGMNNQSM